MDKKRIAITTGGPLPASVLTNAALESSASPALLSDKEVIAMLIRVARAAHALADGTCDDRELQAMTIEPSDFDELSKALDALEELPERGPNIFGTGPAKAEAFLGR